MPTTLVTVTYTLHFLPSVTHFENLLYPLTHPVCHASLKDNKLCDLSLCNPSNELLFSH